MDDARSLDRALWIWALVLCLPPALIPNYNRDLFWHLSDARWIWLHRALPTRDFLSWTKAGAPWVDFEWAWELGAGAFYRLAGLSGLLALKFLFIAANAWACAKLLALRGIKTPWLAAALVLWSAQMLPHCGLQPDLFSLLCFTMTAVLLESRLETPSLGSAALAFLLFAIWAQAHAGFAAGLALFPCYALADILAKKSAAARTKTAAALAAVLGSLCNPYGAGLYAVLLDHLRQSGAMSRFVREWSPLPVNDPFYWPFWVALASLVALSIAIATRRKTPLKKIPWGLAFAAAPLALLSLRHARFSSYFNVPACVLCAALAQSVFENYPARARRTALALLTAYSVFLLATLPRINWKAPFSGPDLPRSAAAFMTTERGEIAPLKLYHPWEWGGYLGWRLRPWFKVFGDGRYLFHDQHAAAEDAFASPAAWQSYLARQGVNAALLPNIRIDMNSLRRYPDGTTRSFERPWFVFYMPRKNWALVYWDSRALLFVSRSAAPRAWLLAHEYRYLHPQDQAAFADALRRGEINARELRREEIRRQAELREFSGS